MASLTALTWRGFWLGTAVLFGLFFLLNYHLYVMPDALSVTVGGFIGAFIFAWIVWLITRFIMKERTPQFQYFLLVLASLSVVAQGMTNLLR
jgi:undecaprenyl pyrophosphate phosphatase UppP